MSLRMEERKYKSPPPPRIPFKVKQLSVLDKKKEEREKEKNGLKIKKK